MLTFVTGNDGKVREAREYLPDPVDQVAYDYAELQADDLEPIAAAGARESFAELDCETPVFVEDSGLFVDALDGFPGPYSAYVEDTLGIERVAELAIAEESTRAAFRSVIAYATAADVGELPSWYDGLHEERDGVTVLTFDGTVRGRIVRPRGDGGFGYDPIFEHDGRTLAERSPAEKNAISHRGRALEKFGDWLGERA